MTCYYWNCFVSVDQCREADGECSVFPGPALGEDGGYEGSAICTEMTAAGFRGATEGMMSTGGIGLTGRNVQVVFHSIGEYVDGIAFLEIECFGYVCRDVYLAGGVYGNIGPACVAKNAADGVW